MGSDQVIVRTRKFIEDKFSGEGSGHDWWHIYRVWKLSVHICENEKAADKFVVELGALLHDIADWKFHKGDLNAGPKAATKWLVSLNVNEKVIKQVTDIVGNVNYKGAGVKPSMNSLEGQIVSDADKLDAMGAIGIARAFAYGGSTNQPIYDPSIKPILHKTFEEYKKNKSHSINHFYEKLLLLQDHLYTPFAKDIALQRHRFMEDYLEEFYKEWEGRA
jgi:uncharacterized protein